MPFFGNDFFAATQGYDEITQNAYLRALWHYWHHTHCDGLPNDDEYLRRVAAVDRTAWARTKPIIFGAFFTQNGEGKWHQKFAKELHERADQVYQRRVENARRATEIRLRQPDDTVDDTVDDIENHSVDINANNIATQPKPKPKPKPDPYPKPDPKPKPDMLKRSNDERLNAKSGTSKKSAVSRSSLNRSKERLLMRELDELLGQEEMKRAGGHWRIDWVRQHPKLVERVLAELRLQLREKAVIVNRGAFCEDLLKRWATA